MTSQFAAILSLNTPSNILYTLVVRDFIFIIHHAVTAINCVTESGSGVMRVSQRDREWEWSHAWHTAWPRVGVESCLTHSVTESRSHGPCDSVTMSHSCSVTGIVKVLEGIKVWIIVSLWVSNSDTISNSEYMS